MTDIVFLRKLSLSLSLSLATQLFKACWVEIPVRVPSFQSSHQFQALDHLTSDSLRQLAQNRSPLASERYVRARAYAVGGTYGRRRREEGDGRLSALPVPTALRGREDPMTVRRWPSVSGNRPHQLLAPV